VTLERTWTLNHHKSLQLKSKQKKFSRGSRKNLERNSLAKAIK